MNRIHFYKKLKFILLIIFTAYVSSSSLDAKTTSQVYWNECFDMGGVRVFLNRCECVNGIKFDPRTVPKNFICSGVGSELYKIMLSEGQISHEGLIPPNVGRRYNYDSFRLDEECRNLIQARCYNRRTNSCVCGNGYPISLTQFWPNTRNCFGNFVSFGAKSAKEKFKDSLELLHIFRSVEGDFGGILHVIRGRSCNVSAGNDNDLVECSVNDFEPNFVSIVLDYRHLNLKYTPSCVISPVGLIARNLHVKFLGHTHLIIESHSTENILVPIPGESCPIGDNSTENRSDIDTFPIEFDISFYCSIND